MVVGVVMGRNDDNVWMFVQVVDDINNMMIEHCKSKEKFIRTAFVKVPLPFPQRLPGCSLSL